MHPEFKHSVDLNETRPIHSGRGNSVVALECLTSPLDQSGNGQPIREA